MGEIAGKPDLMVDIADTDNAVAPTVDGILLFGSNPAVPTQAGIRCALTLANGLTTGRMLTRSSKVRWFLSSGRTASCLRTA